MEKNKLWPSLDFAWLNFNLVAIMLFALSGLRDVRAETDTTNVGAGIWPYGVAVNPVTNKIYVANFNSGNVTVIDGATNNTTNVTVGINPYAVAVNPVTNQIYVANGGSANVTVIDGATNNTTPVGAGTGPDAVAVNPVTNKIYVANYGTNNVTVIDGATNTTTTVGAGTYPWAVAVNPVTNKIYVANNGSANVTVIDGATNTTTTVAAGTHPVAVAVNPVTNKIYVANQGSANVTVIDGATNTTTIAGAGTGPWAVAVNPVTNKIYVANYDSSTVTVIDGGTNTAATFPAGNNPAAVAVNPVTNRIYLPNYSSYSTANVVVMDGATNTGPLVGAGTYPWAVAVNPVTNQIYVANSGSANVTVIDGATNTPTTVAAGTAPNAVAVNPVANQIYVANSSSSNVTVIGGATNTTTTVAAGTNPYAVAVNPVTNQIYVANHGSANVTVLDGATNTTTTVAAGTFPSAVAVNPVTNQIYVANYASNNVTVIDGATNTTTTVGAGTAPNALAVNPVTNQIYVTNSSSSNVTVIHGATNTTTTVAAGTNPYAVAVNPVTNQIYVANHGSANVTVIDGATNTTTTVAAGTFPMAVAVNPVTNQIYVANNNSSNVTVIDGATNTTTTVGAGTNPVAVAVNPVTNQIYVANTNGSNVTVIDGATNTTTTVGAGTGPDAVAVNPVTNKIYVANYGSSNVTVITPNTLGSSLLLTAIGSDQGMVTSSATPSFSFAASSGSGPVTPAVQQVYYQVDTCTGQWLAASPAGALASGTTPTLQPGVHTIFAYATDGQDATSINTGFGNGAVIGRIAAYTFLVVNSATVALNGLNQTYDGTPKAVTPTTNPPGLSAAITYDGSAAAPTAAGSYAVLATVTSAGYLGSASGTLTIAKAAQAIIFGALADKTFGDAAFSVSATGGASGNAVTFAIAGGPATIAGSTVTLTGAGVVMVTASQAGDANYLAAADVSRAFNVAKGAQAITFGALSGKTYGDAAFTVSAAGGASGNSVTFAIASGPATIAGSTVTLTGAGVVMVTASQAGNANYLAAADVSRAFNVAKAAQAITFGALADKTFGDAAFNVSATGGASGNALTFAIASGPATIAASTVTLTGAGVVMVTASQAGNANYLAAADVSRALNVAKAGQAINFGALADKTFGDAAFNVSATGGASGNAVTFAIASGPATASGTNGSTITITGAGLVTVRASQAGNANYGAAPDVDQSSTVAKAAQTINFGALADKTFGDAAFNVSATGGASGNAVTFAIASGPATASGTNGSTITITGAGLVTVRASQAGNANYGAAPDVDQSFTVAKAAQTINFGALADKTFGDAAFNVSATGGASGNAVTFAIASGPATIAGSTVTLAGAGMVMVTASQAGDANYLAAADVSRAFTVAKATPAITWANPADLVSGTALNGTQLNATVNVPGTFTYRPAAGTVLGRGANQALSVSFAPTDAADYNAASATVSINVLNAAPTLVSQPSATPNPATTGSAVSFSAAANDLNGDTLVYSWDFADGTQATGATVTHTYSVASTYTVSLSVDDGQGGKVSAHIALPVSAPATAPGAMDSDGDGFPDALETAAGSSPNNAAGTPIGGAHANPLPLADAKLSIKLNFAKPGSDAIGLAGTLLLPDGFSIGGAKLLVDIGGVARSFTLDPKGSAKNGKDAAGVASKGTSARTAKFAVKLSKGDFAAVLAPLGLTSANVQNQAVSIPLMVVLGDSVFAKTQAQTYSAKAGKAGATKDKK